MSDGLGNATDERIRIHVAGALIMVLGRLNDGEILEQALFNTAITMSPDIRAAAEKELGLPLPTPPEPE